MRVKLHVVAVGALSVALIIVASHARVRAASFRPPVQSEAHLTDQQSLSLVISAVNQQLVHGPIHGDFLHGIANARPSKQHDWVTTASVAFRGVLPDGEYIGMTSESPVIQGDRAVVPVSHRFLQMSDSARKGPVVEVPDTLVFVREAGGWILDLAQCRPASPLLAAALDASVSARKSRLFQPSGVSGSAIFEYLWGDSLLLPKSLHSQANVLNSATSNSAFQTDIFSVPWGICAASYHDRGIQYNDYLFVGDFSWSRVVGADNAHSWISVRGGVGTGQFQFSCPMGIAGSYGSYYMADALNNRVVKYHLVRVSYEDSDVEFEREITCGFNYPTDVDLNDHQGGLLIADNGNGQIVRYGASCGYDSERIGTKGNGRDQFLNPMSVCWGRDLMGWQDSSVFYVADRGNARLTRVSRTVDGQYFFSSDTLPGSDLVSVDVDNYGQVYALDAATGTLYKFSSYLVPLAAYAFPSLAGTAFYPHALAIGHGYEWVEGTYPPLKSGDAFITQNYGASTGVHRYSLGVDVLFPVADYVYRTDTDPQDRVEVGYTLTDIANVTVTVSYQGMVYFQSGPSLQVSGPQSRVIWQPSPNAPSGTYDVQVRAQSTYTNSNTSVWTSSLEVSRDSTNHVPVIHTGPEVFCSTCTCYVASPTVGYVVTVDAYDPEGGFLTYHWKCDSWSKFESGSDSITTRNSSVTYYLLGNPPPPENRGLAPDYTYFYVAVRVTDPAGGFVQSEETHFRKCPDGATDACCCCPHPGDMDSNGVLNALDIMKLVNIVFKAAANVQDPYCPITRADFNGDGITNVQDVMSLVNKVFKSGPPPCNPCNETCPRP